MKNYLLFVIFSILLVGCETEPLDPSLNTNGPVSGTGGGVGANQVDLLGTWNVTQNDTELENTSTFMGQTTTVMSTSALVGGDPTLTFNMDGTFVQAGSMEIQTTLIGGPSQTQTVPFNTTGTYTLSGTILTLAAQSQNQEYTIVVNTANLIELEAEISESFDAGGATNNVTGTQFITLER
ncbi:hypothetical protein [Nonlabens xiamenensis]|uniref:hypothetical protein n=1 Tax=Nonlabens xiamenensis TaxID=2341043 RepID=UPI000F60DF17|nr:hypothetical protein [Nonlabens xiamenensis]